MCPRLFSRRGRLVDLVAGDRHGRAVVSRKVERTIDDPRSSRDSRRIGTVPTSVCC
jgi:hypothetical protein